MRISSNMFYASSLPGILNQQSAMSTLNQQIATGNKLLTAADDPIAAGQIMALNDKISLSTQYTANQQNISQIQSEESTVLNQLQSSLQSAKSLLGSVNGSSGTSTQTSSAATLSGLYQMIKDMANHQDTNGNYIFAGFNSDTQPYSQTAIYGTATTTSPATSYLGDAGQRQVQISQGQTVAANDSLNSVMQSGTASDLLQTLDQIASDLKNGTATQTSLSSAYSVVSNALDNLQSVQSALTGRQLQVSNQQDVTKQFMTNDQNTLGNLSQVDQTKAIVELQQRQTSLQAAESAFSTTAKLSLFNYL
jgi:flagellar hook-associated protein 3 FlgL